MGDKTEVSKWGSIRHKYCEDAYIDNVLTDIQEIVFMVAREQFLILSASGDDQSIGVNSHPSFLR